MPRVVKKPVVAPSQEPDFEEMNSGEPQPRGEIVNYQEHEDVDELADLEIVDKIRALHGKTGTGAEIYLYRVTSTGKDVYITKIAAIDYDQDWVKKSYGGGSYHLRGYHQRVSDNKTVLFLNELLEIEESPAERDARIRPQQQQNSGGFDLNGLAQIMAENNRQIMESVRAMIPVAPPVDAKKDLLDTLTLLQKLQPVPVAAKEIDPLKMFDTVLAMVDRAKELRGDGPSDPLTSAMEKFGPPLLQAFTQSRQPENNQPAPLNQPEGNDAVNIKQVMIGQMLKTLLNAAMKNSSPETYATVVLDQAETYGQTAFDNLVEFVVDEKCVDNIIELLPPAAQHRPWFEQLRAHIIGQLDMGDDSLNPHPDEGYQKAPQVDAAFDPSAPLVFAQHVPLIPDPNIGTNLTNAPESGISAGHEPLKSL